MHQCAFVTHVAVPQRIMAVKYAFPAGLPISEGCQDLLSRIFVASPQQVGIPVCILSEPPLYIANGSP